MTQVHVRSKFIYSEYRDRNRLRSDNRTIRQMTFGQKDIWFDTKYISIFETIFETYFSAIF